MPRIDLGDSNLDNTALPARPPLRRCVLQWTQDGRARSLVLIAQATVEAGRLSTRDLCLRVEPGTEPANYEKSMKISSHHFSLRYLGSAIQFVDKGSTNGSFLENKRVEANSPILIDCPTKLSLADVLELELEPVRRADGPALAPEQQQTAMTNAADAAWLQRQFIGEDKPGNFDFLRIRRTNNLPETQYIILYHSGKIGSGEDSLLCLPKSVTPPTTKPRRTRAFDVGDSVSPASPARLFIRESGIWLERTGAEQVIIAGESLQVGQCRALAPGELTVAETIYTLLDA